MSGAFLFSTLLITLNFVITLVIFIISLAVDLRAGEMRLGRTKRRRSLTWPRVRVTQWSLFPERWSALSSGRWCGHHHGRREAPIEKDLEGFHLLHFVSFVRQVSLFTSWA
ncbi:hypothetical protein QBC32DRAFT_165726 [Pseudoneurospora amorphoporcata]|uniref:Uncharacterized protein n=1 Tax=Pseudoneurospora amorphoporcata TaxID=241081 RepID=A0AAN6NT59_9PEZI|nr:hypothetical protein QBC32DRAFT_165726 [Pseudoneurospora amorphoporcata]